MDTCSTTYSPTDPFLKSRLCSFFFPCLLYKSWIIQHKRRKQQRVDGWIHWIGKEYRVGRNFKLPITSSSRISSLLFSIKHWKNKKRIMSFCLTIWFLANENVFLYHMEIYSHSSLFFFLLHLLIIKAFWNLYNILMSWRIEE